MKIFEYFKLDGDGTIKSATFTGTEMTKDRQKYYEDNYYSLAVYATAEDWVRSFEDEQYSDGECLDMLIELFDKNFIEETITLHD